MSNQSEFPRRLVNVTDARVTDAKPADGRFAILPSRAPLTEVCPAAPGDASAAIGFALAWALTHAKGLILWAFPEHLEAEHGEPYAEGLAQFGANLDRVLLVRTPNQADTLWAAEQALSVSGAFALCSIAPSPKGMSLTASRRLLLLTEKHQSRCVLARFDAPSASAAWARFSVQVARSEGAGRELGPPAFHARLTRNRAGHSGQSWRLVWNPHDNALVPAKSALDGGVAAAFIDRQAAPARRIAI